MAEQEQAEGFREQFWDTPNSWEVEDLSRAMRAAFIDHHRIMLLSATSEDHADILDSGFWPNVARSLSRKTRLAIARSTTDVECALQDVETPLLLVIARETRLLPRTRRQLLRTRDHGPLFIACMIEECSAHDWRLKRESWEEEFTDRCRFTRFPTLAQRIRDLSSIVYRAVKRLQKSERLPATCVTPTAFNEITAWKSIFHALAPTVADLEEALVHATRDHTDQISETELLLTFMEQNLSTNARRS